MSGAMGKDRVSISHHSEKGRAKSSTHTKRIEEARHHVVPTNQGEGDEIAEACRIRAEKGKQLTTHSWCMSDSYNPDWQVVV